MSIVFLILKIIGILLFILLCLILLILFHPIFYQVEGEAEENRSVQGYFWWLFQILRLEFRWEEQETKVKLRIFGFSRNLGEDDTEEDLSEDTVSEKKECRAGKSGVEGDEDLSEKSASESRKTLSEKSVSENEKNLSEESIPESDKDPSEKLTAKSSKSPVMESNAEVSDTGKKQKQGEKAKKKEHKKKKKREEKKEQESGIRTRWKQFRQEAAEDRNRQAVSHLWRELCYLLAHLKPRYVKAEISFSAGDPALTGEVTGVLSLFPLIYRYDACIYPDFLAEAFYIKGSLQMKGHIAVFHFFIVLIRLFLDKNVKRLYHTLKDGF